MCKKCAMVGDGDGWQWPPRDGWDSKPSGPKIWGPVPSTNPAVAIDGRRAGGRACHRTVQPGGCRPPLPRWVHHLAAVGEQSRLEYPERMATIRPGKVIEVLPWEWWWRFGWCYQVAEGWRLSRGANQQGSRVPSSHMIAPDCPCFPRKQSKQPSGGFP